MVEVFIAHAPEDAPLVRPLAEAVAREGYGVGRDEDGDDARADAIGAAAAVIVIWSEAALACREVRAAARLALDQAKLVQASIGGRMPPLPFNMLHSVPIGDWRGEADHPGWTRVRERLASLCRGEDRRPARAEDR
jgi:hypothetical protein